jgi:hypothetical protein
MSARREPTTIWRDLVLRILFAMMIIAFGLGVVGYVQKIATLTIQNATQSDQQPASPASRRGSR